MADALSFKIENGVLAFSIVDPLETLYEDAWQAPAGKTVDTALLADYETGAAQWSCQIQTATIDASANNNDETVDATWCSPSKTIPNPGETTFAINGTFVSDPHNMDGLWAFLYEFDTQEAYFMMGLNTDTLPPKAIGRVRIIAASFGGPARTTMTASLNALPLSRRYDAWVGSAAPGRVIEGYPTGALLGAPASSPAPSTTSSSSTSSSTPSTQAA
jgi:hypothetical protein